MGDLRKGEQGVISRHASEEALGPSLRIHAVPRTGKGLITENLKMNPDVVGYLYTVVKLYCYTWLNKKLNA